MNNTELCKLIEERKDELIVFVGMDGNHCLTPDILNVSMNGGSIQITLSDYQRDEAEANALIAAAPELLAALQGMFNMNLDAIELGEPFDEKLWEQAEQAIAKAEGGAA